MEFEFNISGTQKKLIFSIIKRFCNGSKQSKKIADIVKECNTNPECFKKWKERVTKKGETEKYYLDLMGKNLSHIIPKYSRTIFYTSEDDMHILEDNQQKKYYWLEYIDPYEISKGKYIRLDDIEEKNKNCVNILQSNTVLNHTEENRKRECIRDIDIFNKYINKSNYSELPTQLRNIKYIEDYKYQEHSKSHRYDEDVEKKKKYYKDNELRKNPKTKNTYLQDMQQKSEPISDFDNEKFKEVELEDPEYILKDGTKLKYKFKYHYDYYKEKKIYTIGKEPLFTISYNRSEKACLNYRAKHFLGSDFDNRLCFLFLQEQDVEEYYEKWGGLGYIFVYIPKIQGFTDVFEDFGIGQTRRCLQVFSKHILNDLKLDYYWSLDDNIPYFWKLKDEKKGNVETSIDDFQIIEDKGTSIIMNEIIKYKDDLPEPKSTITDIEDSTQKAMIGCFQNRGSFNFRNKLLPDLFGARQYHVHKFLLIRSKTCFNKMVFYRGIGDYNYGILNKKLCNKPLYSHCKEDTTFSRELCESQVSIYKLYNFIFFGYSPGYEGVSTEFIINEKMSENIKKQPEDQQNVPIHTPIQEPKPDLITTEIISNNNFYTNYYTTKKTTKPYMTKFEKSKILGLRAEMLANGSTPLVNVPKNTINVIDIAKLELSQLKMPFIIKRSIPNNTCEYWRIDEMIINY